MNKPGPIVRYRLDAYDRIRSVSEDWLAFARRNGAAHLDESVVGQSIWRFIDGRETRELYRLLFERVRDWGTPVSFPLRCDSPEQRRYLTLTIQPAEQEGLELQTETVREEPRPAVPLFETLLGAEGDQLTVCSWCKRVLVNGEAWVEAEEAIERLDLFGDAPMPNISYGICPACKASIRATLEEPPPLKST